MLTSSRCSPPSNDANALGIRSDSAKHAPFPEAPSAPPSAAASFAADSGESFLRSTPIRSSKPLLKHGRTSPEPDVTSRISTSNFPRHMSLTNVSARYVPGRTCWPLLNREISTFSPLPESRNWSLNSTYESFSDSSASAWALTPIAAIACSVTTLIGLLDRPNI